ncbi:hypothetical protein SNEBB_009646 [Seison nebaliae]|nr:hypothetical protein SNEBB_009646 [Seison nebaliae]
MKSMNSAIWLLTTVLVGSLVQSAYGNNACEVARITLDRRVVYLNRILKECTLTAKDIVSDEMSNCRRFEIDLPGATEDKIHITTHSRPSFRVQCTSGGNIQYKVEIKQITLFIKELDEKSPRIDCNSKRYIAPGTEVPGCYDKEGRDANGGFHVYSSPEVEIEKIFLPGESRKNSIDTQIMPSYEVMENNEKLKVTPFFLFVGKEFYRHGSQHSMYKFADNLNIKCNFGNSCYQDFCVPCSFNVRPEPGMCSSSAGYNCSNSFCQWAATSNQQCRHSPSVCLEEVCQIKPHCVYTCKCNAIVDLTVNVETCGAIAVEAVLEKVSNLHPEFCVDQYQMMLWAWIQTLSKNPCKSCGGIWGITKDEFNSYGNHPICRSYSHINYEDLDKPFYSGIWASAKAMSMGHGSIDDLVTPNAVVHPAYRPQYEELFNRERGCPNRPHVRIALDNLGWESESSYRRQTNLVKGFVDKMYIDNNEAKIEMFVMEHGLKRAFSIGLGKEREDNKEQVRQAHQTLDGLNHRRMEMRSDMAHMNLEEAIMDFEKIDTTAPKVLVIVPKSEAFASKKWTAFAEEHGVTLVVVSGNQAHERMVHSPTRHFIGSNSMKDWSSICWGLQTAVCQAPRIYCVADGQTGDICIQGEYNPLADFKIVIRNWQQYSMKYELNVGGKIMAGNQVAYTCTKIDNPFINSHYYPTPLDKHAILFESIGGSITFCIKKDMNIGSSLKVTGGPIDLCELPCYRLRVKVKYSLTIRGKACPPGYYGSDCTCKCNCLDGICDMKTGCCEKKLCQPGFFGQQCGTTCPPSSWGHQCQHTCNTIDDSNMCHHVYGPKKDCTCQHGYTTESKCQTWNPKHIPYNRRTGSPYEGDVYYIQTEDKLVRKTCPYDELSNRATVFDDKKGMCVPIDESSLNNVVAFRQAARPLPYMEDGESQFIVSNSNNDTIRQMRIDQLMMQEHHDQKYYFCPDKLADGEIKLEEDIIMYRHTKDSCEGYLQCMYDGITGKLKKSEAYSCPTNSIFNMKLATRQENTGSAQTGCIDKSLSFRYRVTSTHPDKERLQCDATVDYRIDMRKLNAGNTNMRTIFEKSTLINSVNYHV